MLLYLKIQMYVILSERKWPVCIGLWVVLFNLKTVCCTGTCYCTGISTAISHWTPPVYNKSATGDLCTLYCPAAARHAHSSVLCVCVYVLAVASPVLAL